MRMAIISGLMAVGLLTGCGGPEVMEQPEAAEGAVSAQDVNSGCMRVCIYDYNDCLDYAYGDDEALNACWMDYNSCRVGCGYHPPS